MPRRRSQHLEQPEQQQPSALTTATMDWASQVNNWFQYTVEASRDTCRLTPSYLSDDEHMSTACDDDDVLLLAAKEHAERNCNRTIIEGDANTNHVTPLTLPTVLVPTPQDSPHRSSPRPTGSSVISADESFRRPHRSIDAEEEGEVDEEDDNQSIPRRHLQRYSSASMVSKDASFRKPLRGIDTDEDDEEENISDHKWALCGDGGARTRSFSAPSLLAKAQEHAKSRFAVVEAMCFDAREDDAYDSDTLEPLPLLPPDASETQSETAQIRRELLEEQHRTSHAASWIVADSQDEDEEDGSTTLVTEGSGTTATGTLNTAVETTVCGDDEDDVQFCSSASTSSSVSSHSSSSHSSSTSFLDSKRGSTFADEDDHSSYTSALGSELAEQYPSSDDTSKFSNLGISMSQSQSYYSQSIQATITNSSIHTMSFEYGSKKTSKSNDPYLIISHNKSISDRNSNSKHQKQPYNNLVVASASNVSQSDAIGNAIRAALSAQHGLEMEAPPSFSSMVIHSPSAAALTHRFHDVVNPVDSLTHSAPASAKNGKTNGKEASAKHHPDNQDNIKQGHVKQGHAKQGQAKQDSIMQEHAKHDYAKKDSIVNQDGIKHGYVQEGNVKQINIEQGIDKQDSIKLDVRFDSVETRNEKAISERESIEQTVADVLPSLKATEMKEQAENASNESDDAPIVPQRNVRSRRTALIEFAKLKRNRIMNASPDDPAPHPKPTTRKQVVEAMRASTDTPPRPKVRHPYRSVTSSEGESSKLVGVSALGRRPVHKTAQPRPLAATLE